MPTLGLGGPTPVESEKPERPIPFIKAAPNWRIGPAMFTAFAGLAARGTMEKDEVAKNGFEAMI
jgi:hypothetical protein